MIRHAWAASLALLIGAAYAAPAIDGKIHLGVASCATSVCHGKLAQQVSGDVWLNEYRIWSAEDRHARAYQTLSSEASMAIASKLGLPSAKTAKICLDCHADNVSADKRGQKFQITDGVGCEACHGGAEQWIESHAESAATHADNLAKGMYPTEDPVARADLCLSCHLGTYTKFASHRIMGAGHPRLSFELEAFTANQPAHYAVDADYRERKGKIDGVNLWLTGQLASAKRYLELLSSERLAADGIFPELAFYDCHGCHHHMDQIRWRPERVASGIVPGTPRLQDQHLLTVRVITSVLAPDDLGRMTQQADALVRAGQKGASAVREQSKELSAWLERKRDIWATQSLPRERVLALRRRLLDLAASGRIADFVGAEQVFLGVESLSLYLGDAADHQAALDRLFETVSDDAAYDPGIFVSVVGRIREGF